MPVLGSIRLSDLQLEPEWLPNFWDPGSEIYEELQLPVDPVRSLPVRKKQFINLSILIESRGGEDPFYTKYYKKPQCLK
jgi:hypothetical protein